MNTGFISDVTQLHNKNVSICWRHKYSQGRIL